VGHLVYLDADVPRDGESQMDLLPPDERAGYEAAAAGRGDGWCIPPPFPDPLPPDLDPDVRWAVERMVPQPLRTFTQPLRLARGEPECRRTYVLHIEDKDPGALPAVVQRVQDVPGWGFTELAATHSAHVTAPRVLADLLLSLA
jgi:hypothetical protein